MIKNKVLLKKIFVYLGVVVGFFIFLMGIAVFILYLVFAPSKVEVALLASPDSSFVAKVIEINGGATTSFGYMIKVENKKRIFSFSEEAAFLYAAGRSPCAYGVDLEWESDRVLLIKYLDARIVDFDSGSIAVGGEMITVKLVSNVTNPSAPCGGMEYSQKHNNGVN